MRYVIVTSVVLIIIGCSDFGETVSSDEPKVPVNIQNIFDDNCIVCHGTSGGMSLAELVSFDNLVNADANGYNAVRVFPGNPDSSVLWNKITNTGRFGQQMPPGNALSFELKIDLFNWITDSAFQR
ncbi:MAG: hypothetical protein H8E14_00150 [Candidatus Marinimicrobia bacterium]|nr:hypothetical protein [Candidatus Neomarinimicrobiota bacterium]